MRAVIRFLSLAVILIGLAALRAHGHLPESGFLAATGLTVLVWVVMHVSNEPHGNHK